MDAEPRGELDTVLCRQADVQGGNGLDNAQTGVNGAPGLVFMGGGIAKIDEQGITDVPGDISLEAVNHCGAGFLVGTYDLTQLLRIELLGASSETNQIGEQHGHDLALLTRRGSGSLEGCAAGTAKTGAGRILPRTVRADDHAESLRPRTASF